MPFLGTTTDVNEAFPDIDEIDVTITQDPYGYYLRNDWQRTSRFSKSTIRKAPGVRQSEMSTGRPGFTADRSLPRGREIRILVQRS